MDPSEVKPADVRVTVEAPDSKKNRGSIISWGPKCRHCGKRERYSYKPGAKPKAQEKAIGLQLDDQVEERPHFGEADVIVRATHHARSDIVDLEFSHLRPRPKGFAGRRRDLANLLDVLLDAAQGSVFKNDNQVAGIVIVRDLD